MSYWPAFPIGEPYGYPPCPCRLPTYWTTTTYPVTFPDSRVDELLKAVEELTKRVDLLTEEVVAMEKRLL